MICLCLLSLLAAASAQAVVDAGGYAPQPPMLVYVQLPDPSVYVDQYQLPMPYAQQYGSYCRYGLDQYGNCRGQEPVKFCTYGVDQYGNCRTMDPYCPYGLDTYGNCRPREKNQCLYGTTRSGNCRKEPARFCAFGEDLEGSCYPKAQHCQFGHDPFGDCIKGVPNMISAITGDDSGGSSHPACATRQGNHSY